MSTSTTVLLAISIAFGCCAFIHHCHGPREYAVTYGYATTSGQTFFNDTTFTLKESSGVKVDAEIIRKTLLTGDRKSVVILRIERL